MELTRQDREASTVSAGTRIEACSMFWYLLCQARVIMDANAGSGSHDLMDLVPGLDTHV